jgi:hypothetical protein
MSLKQVSVSSAGRGELRGVRLIVTTIEAAGGLPIRVPPVDTRKCGVSIRGAG